MDPKLGLSDGYEAPEKKTFCVKTGYLLNQFDERKTTADFANILCRALVLFSIMTGLGSAAIAQNVNGSSSTWTGSWQFQSATARSVEVQQADIMKRGESGYYDSFGPAQTTVNNTTINDSRSNYVEATGSEGSTMDIANRIGDEIGKVSNVTGAINTGSTQISVDGAGNTIHAINRSDSQGCLDGSINETQTQTRFLDPSSSASVLNSVAGFGFPVSVSTSNSTGGSQSGCVTR
jgi:hypothetical protein